MVFDEKPTSFAWDDKMGPLFWVNILSTCALPVNCTSITCTTQTALACYPPQQVAQALVSKIHTNVNTISDPDLKLWYLDNMAVFLLGFGSETINYGLDNSAGIYDDPARNPTSFFRLEDAVEGHFSFGWPDSASWSNKRPWRTPWMKHYNHSTNPPTEVGGIPNAKSWMEDFLEAFEASVASYTDWPITWSVRVPRYFVFDNENKFVGSNANYTYLLAQMPLDSRWDTMPVPGSKSTSYPNGRTMAQLWADYRDRPGVRELWCGGNCPCELDDFLCNSTTTVLQTSRGMIGSNMQSIRQDMIASWYIQVCNMALNGALEESAYSLIRSRTGWMSKCEVIQFADVSVEVRRTENSERFGWHFDRVYSQDSTTIQSTNTGTLGQYDVNSQPMQQRFGTPDPQLDQCTALAYNGTPHCNIARFPLYLYPYDAATSTRIVEDRSSFVHGTLLDQGLGVAADYSSPFLYTVKQIKQQPDLYKPAPATCIDLSTCIGVATESTFDAAMRENRHYLDSIFFSGNGSESVFPWIPQTQIAPFPTDSNPLYQLTKLDSVRQFMQLRAFGISKILGFANPRVAGSAGDLNLSKWQDFQYAYDSVYGLIQTEIAPPLHGTDIALDREVERTSRVNYTLQGNPYPEPYTYKLSSVMVNNQQTTAAQFEFRNNPEHVVAAPTGEGLIHIRLEQNIVVNDAEIPSVPWWTWGKFYIYNKNAQEWELLVCPDSNTNIEVPEKAYSFYPVDASTRRDFYFYVDDLDGYYGAANETLQLRIVNGRTAAHSFTCYFDLVQVTLLPGMSLPAQSASMMVVEGGVAADMDFNGELDGSDSSLFAESFLSQGAPADLNNDQAVDVLDIEQFVESYNP